MPNILIFAFLPQLIQPGVRAAHSSNTLENKTERLTESSGHSNVSYFPMF